MKTTGFALAGAAVLAGVGFLGLINLLDQPGHLPADLPQMQALPGGAFSYRPAGEFRNGVRVLDAPKRQVEIPGNLEIMRFPVTQADYGLCVSDGACKPTISSGSSNLPQTHVSYRDATDFAQWQSNRTGQTWRLPTGPEWAHAAAEKYVDEVVEDAPVSDDPAQRWLNAYQASARQRYDADPTLRAIGSYGQNTLGLGYIGGNVWEWTTTCFIKGEVNAEGKLVHQTQDYCGVRLAQGVHRAFIIDFVRDASVGGCAVGLPPDHLAIRLVREN